MCKINTISLVLYYTHVYIYTIIKANKMKNQTRFNEVTTKLNKMFKGQSESKKDELVKNLKNWCKLNGNIEEKGKVDAIKCFLADNNIF